MISLLTPWISFIYIELLRLLHSMANLLEVTPISLAYICLGGFVAVLSVFLLLVREKIYINEVVLGTGFGILMGPLCAGVFDPRSWSHDTNRITLEVMRIVLATGLFAIGVQLPKAYMWKHMKGLVAMIVPTMAIGWIIVAALMKALFSRFSFITCLALAACLTPTDPVISAAILTGKFAQDNVDPRLINILSAESAANDGLAYPFLSISLYLTLEPNRGKDIVDWVLVGWLYQVILGTFIGAVIGYTFSRVMRFSFGKDFINRESYVPQFLALAIFTMGVVNAIGSDDLLAAFAAGCAISWDGDFQEKTEGEVFAPVIEYILNCGCFFYIGAWLPWKDFTIPELGINPWKLLVLCIGILLLRRIPALLALYKWVPEIATWREALFCGHFGPMGVGAVFVSTLAIHRLPEPHIPVETQQDILAAALHPVVSFVVLVSIIIHGLSIPVYNAWKVLTQPDPVLPSHHATDATAPQVLPSTVLQDGKNSPLDTPAASAIEVSLTPFTGTSSSAGRTTPVTGNEREFINNTKDNLDYKNNTNTTTSAEVMDIVSNSPPKGRPAPGAHATLVQ